MIQLFHVTKVYTGGSIGLKDVSLRVTKGDFLFITGASGAGKTTLLKLLFCMEQATEGQILVDGRNITRIPRMEMTRLRRITGFVFQDFKLLNNLSALDNVALALQVQGIPPKEIRSRAYQALRSVGLADDRDKKPLQLSAGEQQRVAIARALANNPLILLADEPTGNLDPSLSREIMDQFLSIHKQGTTLIVATHSEELIEYAGQKRINLHKGRVVESPEGTG